MSKRRKKRRRSGGCKNTALAAIAEVDRLRDLAKDHDLEVGVSEVDCRRGVKTFHFRFYFGAETVLHYWPGNGTTWNPRTGAKTKVADCWAALDLAAEIRLQSYPLLAAQE